MCLVEKSVPAASLLSTKLVFMLRGLSTAIARIGRSVGLEEVVSVVGDLDHRRTVVSLHIDQVDLRVI